MKQELEDELRDIINDATNAKQAAVLAAQDANEFASNSELVEPANQLLNKFKDQTISRLTTLIEKRERAVYEIIMEVAGEYRGTGELADYVNVDDLGRVSLARLASLTKGEK